jgi:hypothetical protein
MEFMAWFTQICDAWIFMEFTLDHHVPNRDTFEKTICFLDLWFLLLCIMLGSMYGVASNVHWFGILAYGILFSCS